MQSDDMNTSSRGLAKGILRLVGIGLKNTILNRFKKTKQLLGNFPRVGFLDEKKKTDLELVLDIKITRKELFEQALTHRSYLQVMSNEQIYSNERLEFLGDSILGMVVAEFLFSLHTEVGEGDLTKMRSWLVNSRSLSICARKFQLDEFLMLSFSATKSLEQGSDSILADALEAIIAAMYLDSGIECARNFIVGKLLPFLMESSIMVDTNFKSILLEKVQAIGHESPKYMVLDEKGPDHDKEFTIGVYVQEKLLAVGKGKNKKQAEQLAAKLAIEQNIF